ncbi:hypothetical protein VPIG_00186 [Vibrio phage PWH3a-P1]|uniref:hypothetical protein n=1 Tax=Vibrio phage PWH3a-P1 TaxID=754058 RepID=UPI0002C07207|nr:hypothetical protein VPIG_00186 [Vibrio phage PWH3a-P1]AGH32042.1 hypothetical protein VPIG_00186 [Vibrio phage PWH3a-P1]
MIKYFKYTNKEKDYLENLNITYRGEDFWECLVNLQWLYEEAPKIYYNILAELYETKGCVTDDDLEAWMREDGELLKLNSVMYEQDDNLNYFDEGISPESMINFQNVFHRIFDYGVDVEKYLAGEPDYYFEGGTRG